MCNKILHCNWWLDQRSVLHKERTATRFVIFLWFENHHRSQLLSFLFRVKRYISGHNCFSSESRGRFRNHMFGQLTEMTAEVFDEFNSLVFLLLPELQVTITACCYDEIGSKANKKRSSKKSLRIFSLHAPIFFLSIYSPCKVSHLLKTLLFHLCWVSYLLHFVFS